jgi:hypothetical protein
MTAVEHLHQNLVRRRHAELLPACRPAGLQEFTTPKQHLSLAAII